jgi:hypothetical protein
MWLFSISNKCPSSWIGWGVCILNAPQWTDRGSGDRCNDEEVTLSNLDQQQSLVRCNASENGDPVAFVCIPSPIADCIEGSADQLVHLFDRIYDCFVHLMQKLWWLRRHRCRCALYRPLLSAERLHSMDQEWKMQLRLNLIRRPSSHSSTGRNDWCRSRQSTG